jgi:hypothetical protein
VVMFVFMKNQPKFFASVRRFFFDIYYQVQNRTIFDRTLVDNPL